MTATWSCFSRRTSLLLWLLAAGCSEEMGGPPQGMDQPDLAALPDQAPAEDLQEPRVSGWMSGPKLNVARAEIAAAVIGTRIFVGGGFASDQPSFEELDARDLQTARWVRRADLPSITYDHLGMAALGGKVYVTRDRALLVYDPQSDRWTRGRDMPLRRSAHVMAAARGRLYVVGGVGDEPKVTLEYDPAGDAWARRAPMPLEREHLAAAVVNDRVYVIGGRWSGRGNTNAVEEYDPATDQWRARKPMPTARGGLTAAAVGSRIHVTGGEAFDPNRTFPEHEIYDPSDDSWRSGPPLPTARHGLASASVDGRLFVIGGGRTAGFSVSELTEIYTP